MASIVVSALICFWVWLSRIVWPLDHFCNVTILKRSFQYELLNRRLIMSRSNWLKQLGTKMMKSYTFLCPFLHGNHVSHNIIAKAVEVHTTQITRNFTETMLFILMISFNRICSHLFIFYQILIRKRFLSSARYVCKSYPSFAKPRMIATITVLPVIKHCTSLWFRGREMNYNIGGDRGRLWINDVSRAVTIATVKYTQQKTLHCSLCNPWPLIIDFMGLCEIVNLWVNWYTVTRFSKKPIALWMCNY